MPLTRNEILIVAASAIGLGGYFYLEGEDSEVEFGGDTGGSSALAAVAVPDVLSARAQIGQGTYEANCAACHGPNAAGQDGVAPPLVHVIYEPGHHGDESFQLAVARGVRAHHWRFGDMPPVEGLNRRDVGRIVTYIRELQRANGIE